MKKKSMQKKINVQFTLLAVVAILLTLLLTVAAFYEVFKKEMLTDLRIYTTALQDAGTFSQKDDYTYTPNVEGLRISIVDADGNVIYDTGADTSTLENHKNRPEIAQALKTGSGEAVRHSDTLDKNCFYFAVLQEDGTVLRVSREAGSAFSILLKALPEIIGIAVVIALISMFLAHFLTKSLVQPIERMAKDMDHLDSIPVYKELVPFVNTIQKQHEDIIKNATVRQEFTANVSHELKTPLTSISGYSELIENGMATEEDTIRFAGEIHKNSNRLLTLINDIIRLSELDDTDNRPFFEQVDLYDIAQNCVGMLTLNAEKHKVSLSLTGEHEKVKANKEMMEELVFNLTDNAIRYNNAGGYVKLDISKKEDAVVLSVQDNGIGIPKEHQDRIFERFYRVDKSRSKSTGGTGLGLAIVKHILVQHDAKLDLDSEVGKGTTIRVYLKAD